MIVIWEWNGVGESDHHVNHNPHSHHFRLTHHPSHPLNHLNHHDSTSQYPHHRSMAANQPMLHAIRLELLGMKENCKMKRFSA